MTDLSSLSREFFECGVVKIDFEKGWTLKSGLWSPIYINFRVLQSYPNTLKKVVQGFAELLEKDGVTTDLVAGIPLAALSLSLGLSMETGVPHVLPRMDSKKHGLGVKVDGVYSAGQTVLLVDDLITKATSKIEAVDELTQAGLQVTDVVVVLDREQGGAAELAKKNLKLHSLMTLDDLLTALETSNSVDAATIKKIRAYLADTK